MDQRKLFTQGRSEANAMWAAINAMILASAFGPQGDPGLDDGTTAGTLKTTTSMDYTVDGFSYTKAATDDLWDLSGETDTTAVQYRAYGLYLNNAGAASIVAGSNQVSVAEALVALAEPATDQSLIGVFVADPACDFDAGGGLSAQGTLYTGAPDGLRNVGALGVRTLVAG